MESVSKLYKNYTDGGRVFLHGSPAHAKSWALPCIKKLMREMGVFVVEVDQCMFGLKNMGPEQIPANAGEEAYALHDELPDPGTGTGEDV